MTKRPSIDEIVAKRRASADDDGKLYKAIILDDVEEKAGYSSESRAQRFTMSTEEPDLYQDIVRQDGLSLDNFMKNPVGLAFHDHTAPIGWWKDVVKIGGKAKRHEGTLVLHAAGTTAAVDEIDRLLAANAIKACSIGFSVVDADWILDEEGRMTWGLDFKSSILLECSVCSIPANPQALAKAAGGDMRLAAELFEKVLDTYCEKTTGGLFVRKEFADAYMAMKGEKTAVAGTKTVDEARRSLHLDVTAVMEEPEADANKLSIELEVDTTEAERKIGGLTKMFDGLIQKAREFAGIVPDMPEKEADKYDGSAAFEGDGDDLVIKSDWPKFCRISRKAVEDGINASREGDVITFRCANSIAEYKIDDEGNLGFDVSLIRSYDPPPAIIKGSRAKAIVARERLKQTLHDKGLLT